MMVDLDNFKRVNDTHGHHAGDAVLRETARTLLASIRSYDSVGRYGGEEFVVIAPGCNLAAAMEQAERLRECVARQAVCVAGNMVIPTTISIGVAATDNSSSTRSTHARGR